MADDVTVLEAELFSLPLQEFIAARDRLAARLMDQGEAGEAERVAKLRKPTVAAWALNRAARHHPDVVDDLLDSHRRLRQARSAAEMQVASESRKRSVAQFERAAVAELTADGRQASSQTRERIATTLLAVATDPQAESDLKEGRLVREIEPSGTGWADIPLPPSPTASPAHRAQLAAQKARTEAERLEKVAVTAEEAVETAKRNVAEAKKRAKTARARAQKAAEAAQQAEEAARETSQDPPNR